MLSSSRAVCNHGNFDIWRPSKNLKIIQRNTRREVIFSDIVLCVHEHTFKTTCQDQTERKFESRNMSGVDVLKWCNVRFPYHPMRWRRAYTLKKKKLTQRFKSLISFNMTAVHVKYRVTWKSLILFIESRTWSDERTPLLVISDLEGSPKVIAHTTRNWWSSRALLSSVYLRRTVSWLLSQITQINYDIPSNAISQWNRVINSRHSSACHIVWKDFRCQTSVVNAKSVQ